MAASRDRRDDEDDDRPHRRRDDEDDDDRPRRRRDDEDDDDRPRSRSRSDEDDDDRPRRRPRDDDEDDDRPRRRRRPRRRSAGPGAGVILAVVGGGLGVVVVGVIVVLFAKGSFGSGGGDISYEKFSAISQTDTTDGLRQKFGRPRKYERAEWDSVVVGEQGGRRAANGSSALSQYNSLAREVTSWYGWRKGQEEVYVAEGTDIKGRQGLVIKIYCNPKVVEDAVLNPDAPKTNTPWFQVDQIGVGGGVRFGGGNPGR